MRKSKRGGRAGEVRLIGGEWRSRRLRIPPGVEVRPTADRVRETLFNWLAQELAGARCLDLFAGTGALGFEALSRGARIAHFIESDAKLAAALRSHAAELDANAVIRHESADRWLARAPEHAFDIVFLDPPYTQDIEPVAAALAPWLAGRATVYVERAASEALPVLPGFAWRRRRRAGGVVYGIADREP